MGIRRVRRNWYMVLGVFVAVFAFAFLAQKFDGDEVEAANFGAFDPGYIISDYQMTNYTSMNEGQIQSFLKSKNGCNNTATWQTGNNIDHYREATPYSWHVAGGHYVCMADENINGESAAHIIWQAAQDYRINPKVLIVLLQKEQQLVEDSLPNSVQYRSATGYGCPDTAACSSQYYGFKNQVRKAAALFREVMDGGWSNYPVGWNYVRYAPGDCGGSNVNIRNRATSALYRYTPYQPNSAALSVRMGQTVYCGAYGNKNFYGLFEDWFGGVTAGGDDPIYIESNTYRPIEDGTYQVISKSNQNSAIDVRGGVSAKMNNGVLIGYEKKKDITNMDNQIFAIKFNEETGFYNIYNPETNLYFDVESASTKNNARVILWPRNGGCNQDWLIRLDQNNNVSFVSRCSSKVVDLTSSSSIVMFTDYNTGNQKWRLSAVDPEGEKTVENGVYRINLSGTDKVVDVSGGVTRGTQYGKLIPYTEKRISDASLDNQLFTVSYDNSTGYYKIANTLSGASFDVANSQTSDGTAVIIWSNNDGCNQRWKITRKDDGYKIISACSKKSVTADNNKVAIYSDRNNSSQVWKMEKYTETYKENKDYQIISTDNKAIDIYGGITSRMSSGRLITYLRKTVGKENQTFRLEYDEKTKTFFIYNPATKLYLDVAGAGNKDGTDVILFTKNGNCNQRWNISEGENGGYLIASACSGKYLSVSENRLGSSAKVGIYSVDADAAKEWNFK